VDCSAVIAWKGWKVMKDGVQAAKQAPFAENRPA
jgi:hypothetical protein